MLLHGHEFGNVFCAPGARNFDGRGYPFHWLWKYAGMNWEGTGFVTKTVTMDPRPGNMPLRSNGLTPKELFPPSIDIDFRTGHILNSVSFSNFGAVWAFQNAGWNRIDVPFMISFMIVGNTKEEQRSEIERFAMLFSMYRRTGFFKGPVAIQIAAGCPNVGYKLEELLFDLRVMLDYFSPLDVPLVVNLSVATKPEVVVAVAELPVDLLWLGNTIPFGHHSLEGFWEELYPNGNPLATKGFEGGGLSGPWCLNVTTKLIESVRKAGVTMPIVGGNGIQHPRDIRDLRNCGADGVAIGSAAIVRPWRMKEIVHTAHDVFNGAPR